MPVELFHTGDDGVEQDLEQIWTATLAAIAAIGAEKDLAGVKAVGVSSQGGAMQMLDGEGQPAGRVISWLDGRGRPYDEEITSDLGTEWFARHTGHGASGVGVGQVLRLRQEYPWLLARPNRIGFVGDVIVARLCGRGAHDATSLSIAMFYNPALDSADPELLRTLGIEEEQLPDLISVGTAAGALLAELSEKTGLTAGIPVSAAAHDQYAAALGVGAVHPGDVMFGAGTAWVLLAATDRLTGPVIDSAFVCRHLLEGLYGQMLSLGNGGSSFTWALNLLGLGRLGPEEIDELLAEVPPGADGVRFRPLLAAFGGAGLVPGVRGRLAGLRLAHTAGHILRAVVEGLACELTRYLRLLTEGGLPVKRLLMCGGAAKSSFTPQLIADTTSLPVACTTESDTSALGAAVIARGLSEKDADLAVLGEAMAPPAQLVQPGADRDFYQKLAEEYAASLPAI